MKKIYLLFVFFYLAKISIGQVTVTVNPASTTICAENPVSITASASSVSPGTIVYSWSPADGLNVTTGATVIATPENSTTYTVTATNQLTGQNATATATVDINPDSYVLAAIAGGPQVCRNLTITPAGTVYRDGNCNVIAGIVPAGANPVTNSINTCSQLLLGATKMGTANLYVARKYDIEPTTNAATATANITLYYLQKEFDDYNEKAADSGLSKIPSDPGDILGTNNLIIRQFHGTGPAPEQYSGSTQDFLSTTPGVAINWNSKNDWWEITVPVTGFSGFYLTSQKGSSTLLPITLEYFKGSPNASKNNLNWKVNCTSTEVAFEIERSDNSQNFTRIGQMSALQARCAMPFDFVDASPLNGKNYYRIKMIDPDGKFKYTHIILVGTKLKKFELVGLNPTIVNNANAILKINTQQRNEMVIAITDMKGRQIQHQTEILRQGANSIKINTGTLSNGVYLLRAFMAGEEPQTIQFIKQ